MVAYPRPTHLPFFDILLKLTSFPPKILDEPTKYAVKKEKSTMRI